MTFIYILYIRSLNRKTTNRDEKKRRIERKVSAVAESLQKEVKAVRRVGQGPCYGEIHYNFYLGITLSLFDAYYVCAFSIILYMRKP